MRATGLAKLIQMERDIRKQRKETLYAQREARKHFLEIVAIILFTTVGGFILSWHSLVNF